MTKFPSRSDYDFKNLPTYIFTKDYTVKNAVLYIKGDEYDSYNYNYERLINYLEDGLLVEKNEDDELTFPFIDNKIKYYNENPEAYYKGFFIVEELKQIKRDLISIYKETITHETC
jgi:hypothetical protein